MGFLKKYSFRWKLFLGMIIAAFVPLLLGYLAMLQVFHITYQSHLKQEAKSSIDEVGTTFNLVFTDLYLALDSLSNSQTIREDMQDGGDGYDFKTYRELYAVSSQYGDYAYFTIYDREGMRQCSVADNKYIKEKLSLDWGGLYDAKRNPDNYIVQNAKIYQGEDKDEFLRITKAIQSSNGEVVGYVVATILKENFFQMLKGIGQSDRGIIYAMDPYNETVFYSSSTYEKNELRQARQALEQGADYYQSNDKKFYYYVETFDTCKLSIYYQQPISSLNQMKNNITIIAVICIVISFSICLFLSIYFSSYFFRPIQSMKNAVTEFQKGNYVPRMEVKREDELGQLSEGFYEVSQHLSENTKMLLQRERELSETNIKMMQAQLNPHFLYNTLDTMKWIGKENNLSEISTISMGLAEILRTSISSKTIICLREEISLVQAYVEIQKIRFEDKFEFLLDMPEELAECKVPKLILQPIVENSILHGFAESEVGTVLIQVSKTEKEELLILVQDDGKGMTAEQVNHLNSYRIVTNTNKAEEKNRSSESIGFYNVNAIIQLNFGTAYGVNVESEEGVGTKVWIRLPVIMNRTIIGGDRYV